MTPNIKYQMIRTTIASSTPTKRDPFSRLTSPLSTSSSSGIGIGTGSDTTTTATTATTTPTFVLLFVLARVRHPFLSIHSSQSSSSRVSLNSNTRVL